ncbi:MAG: hypothetical protein WB495_26345 [Xanthobacteraceae bacterium]|jgi:hypothetical protein
MKARYEIFWTATAVAAALLLWVASDFMFGLEAKFPIINLPGLILAAAIWLVGWIALFAL